MWSLKLMVRNYIYGHGTYCQEEKVDYKTKGSLTLVYFHKMLVGQGYSNWTSACLPRTVSSGLLYLRKVVDYYENPRYTESFVKSH